MNTNPKKLKLKQIQDFNNYGFIFPVEVFSGEEINYHQKSFEELLIKARKKGFDSYSLAGWEEYVPYLYDICLNPAILDYVEDLIGRNILCWVTHYFAKQPGEDVQVSWHQDASYWPLSPSLTVTGWLALDEVDEGNGPMQFIPRSHLHGHIEFEDSTAEENNVLVQKVVAPDQYGDCPVSVIMNAGQMSLHSDLLLHGSSPNRSDRRRCALTFRFTPPEVTPLSADKKEAILCRGENISTGWINRKRPLKENIPDYYRQEWRGDKKENFNQFGKHKRAL